MVLGYGSSASPKLTSEFGLKDKFVMRRFMFAVLIPAVLVGQTLVVAACAQELRAEVDPRVELMSILFRLAGNPEYNQCRVPLYDQAIDGYFAPYRDHEAVQLARSLGIGFEAPMKIAAYVRDAQTLAERVPFDRPSVHLFEKWDAGKARAFLSAARRFAAETNFEAFLNSQQPLYEATNDRLQAFLRDKGDPGWFIRFFGPPGPAAFVIVPGLANGAPSYAARVIDESGAQEIYAIPGVSKVDAGGLPVFDSDWGVTMAHEIADTYASPAINKFAAGMAKAAAQIYEAVAPAMRRQSYGNWRIMLSESLARAATIEYAMEHDGPQAARTVIGKENSRSFFWMSGLVDLLEAYRKDREQYPTFDSFMPRVAGFFNDVAPHIQELTDRLQPKVVSTSIANGAGDVDPGVTKIVIRFNMPMSRVGPDKSAKVSGGRFDDAGTALTIPVTLEPGRDYAIPLRWSGGQAFVSADGVPLPDAVLRFRTGAAPAPKQP
jgi:KaiC/GvpD/RAD55 family RecA-like ATPase